LNGHIKDHKENGVGISQYDVDNIAVVKKEVARMLKNLEELKANSFIF